MYSQRKAQRREQKIVSAWQCDLRHEEGGFAAEAVIHLGISTAAPLVVVSGLAEGAVAAIASSPSDAASSSRTLTAGRSPAIQPS